MALFNGKKFDTVLFDLDGTLLNSLDDLADSVNYALTTQGYPPRQITEVRRFVGNGVENLIRRALPENVSELAIQECLAVFRPHYDRNKENKTKPYPGIERLLTGLKERGYKTGIVSNKYDGAVKALSQRYFGDLIQVAIGESPAVAKKPSPEGIFMALQELGSSAERTLYIGDSPQDIETARNAGVMAGGVLWGFRDQDELTAAEADFLADYPYKIWNVLMACEDGLNYDSLAERDHGEIILTDGAFPFQYYTQNDTRWKDQPFGTTGGTLENDGCGPACLAMVVDTLTESRHGLVAVADWTFQNGHFVEGIGCYHRLAEEGAKHYGLSCEAIGDSWEKLRDGLKAGQIAIAVVKRGHFSCGGHFIVVRGITADEKLLVADPGSIYRSHHQWDKEAVLGDLNLAAGSGGPLWLLGRNDR